MPLRPRWHETQRVKFTDWWYGKTRAAELMEAAEEIAETSSGREMSAPSRQPAARSVSVADALTLPMVYRAVQIHATAAKQLSIGCFRGDEEIEPHPLTRRPDPTMSRPAWIEQSTVALATTGNCYYEVVRDSSRDVVALIVLNPLDVRILTNREGHVTGYKYRGREYRPSQIKHITLLRIPGTAYGLGPIQAAQPDLRGAIDTRDYAANWFMDAGIPSGILKTEQIITKDVADETKERWNDTAGAKNGVAVLGQGFDFRPVFLSPKDAQFIETQQFSVTAIARMFGTPASLMLAPVEGGTHTYQNVEQDWLAYTRFTLMGYLVEMEEALSEYLPGRQRARFNLESLLRADTSTRYKSYSVALGGQPFLSVEEVRGIEHRPPLSAAELAAPTTQQQEQTNA